MDEDVDEWCSPEAPNYLQGVDERICSERESEHYIIVRAVDWDNTWRQLLKACERYCQRRVAPDMDTPGSRIPQPLRYSWICDYRDDGREHSLCHSHSTPRSPLHLTNCHRVSSRQTRQTWPAAAYDSSFNWMWPDGMTIKLPLLSFPAAYVVPNCG